MKKKTLTVLVLLLLAAGVKAQHIVTDLYGFRLGQYRETATNEFGKPLQQQKMDDGFEYEVFLVKPDTSLYLVFEYAKDQPDIIWAIQISGSNTETDLGFKNLRLGAAKKQVEKALGKPDSKENIGDYGERWNYDKANYSVEISTGGTLSSIKIRNTYGGNSPDVSKLPQFKKLVKEMTSASNAGLANLLAPGVELYYKGEVLFFKKSLKTEIETDYSGIFTALRQMNRGLEQINTNDTNAYEENMRLALGHNPKHVVKIRTGHIIKEMVFDYINDRYLIWEINAE